MLQKLRLQHGAGIEHAAHEHHQEAANREVLEFEKPQVDKRFLLSQLPDDQPYDADHEHYPEEPDEVGREPVVLLALIEHDLQAAHCQGQEGKTHVIHVEEF